MTTAATSAMLLVMGRPVRRQPSSMKKSVVQADPAMQDSRPLLVAEPLVQIEILEVIPRGAG